MYKASIKANSPSLEKEFLSSNRYWFSETNNAISEREYSVDTSDVVIRAIEPPVSFAFCALSTSSFVSPCLDTKINKSPKENVEAEEEIEKGSVKHMDLNPSLINSSERYLAARDEPPIPKTEMVEAEIIISERESISSHETKEKVLSILSILDEKTLLKISFELSSKVQGIDFSLSYCIPSTRIFKSFIPLHPSFLQSLTTDGWLTPQI